MAIECLLWHQSFWLATAGWMIWIMTYADLDLTLSPVDFKSELNKAMWNIIQVGLKRWFQYCLHGCGLISKWNVEVAFNYLLYFHRLYFMNFKIPLDSSMGQWKSQKHSLYYTIHFWYGNYWHCFGFRHPSHCLKSTHVGIYVFSTALLCEVL